MRPIRLELTGLNSYIDKQVIDFEKLIERGLFGIFGTTGSGKSTILDAITIAMYGNISRNTKEYINNHTLAIELSSKESNNKNVRMRDIYRSQSYSYKKFKHMIPYEKLIPYSQWEIAE